MPAKIAAHHVESLDVFRGATIAAMILVNNPGDWSAVFRPLQHAPWTGLTAADLVFPWFLFIMGVAMPFAFARRHERGQPVVRLYFRIVQRVVLLIALGLVLNAVAAWPAITPLRIPGVLQRIAVSYLIAAPIVLHLRSSHWMIAAALFLLGHWALLALLPFDGLPAGTMTPGHNLALYLDRFVFGRHSLTIPIDPEGLLGTLSSAATVLGGALVGRMLQAGADETVRLRRLALAGIVAVVSGLAWSTLLPLSKPLWTGSYVLVVSGLATLVLAVTYFVVDVRRARKWAGPLLWLGVNPLAIYFLSELTGHLIERVSIVRAGVSTTAKSWLFWGMLEPALRPRPTEWASLLFGVAYVGLWIGVAAVLYHRQIRIQV
jgi:predicted acyltransferase